MPSSMLYSHLQQQQQSSRLQSNQLQGSNQSLMQIPPVHPSSQALQQPSPTWAKLKEAMYLYFGPLNCKEFYGGFDCDTPPRKRKGFKFDKLDFNFNGPGDFDLDMGFSKEKKSEKSNECGKDNSSIQDVSSASRKELASNNNRSNDGDLETENILEFGVTSKCKDDTRTSNPRKSDGGHVSHTNSMENPSINAATQGTLSSLRSSIVSLEENASVLGFSKFADKSQDMQAQYPNMKNLSTLYGKLVDIANHPGTKSIAKVSEVSPFKIFLKFLKLEEKGLIMSSQSVLIEPISENIGIGLAFMAAPKGTFIWPRTGWRGMSFSVVVLEIAVLATGFLVIAVDGKFPGPVLNVTTNYNVVFNVLNSLDEDLLITWAGIQQRKNSWQQGVLGTNCPIPSDWNWTYQFRVKYQINSFIYFPSLGFQRAVGGYGGITINNRAVISVPFGQPDGDYHIFIGNWYNKNHTDLRKALSDGKDLGMPDGVLINGKGIGYETINIHPGKTYRIRVHNVAISTSLKFRIQNQNMLLVGTEGSDTVQQNYTNLDIHFGQSYSFLVITDQNASSDYYIVASARRVNESLWKRVTGVAILHYSNSIQHMVLYLMDQLMNSTKHFL